MAIANYGELKTTVLSYLNYGEQSVVDNLDLFVKMTYDNLNSSLRIPSMENIAWHDVTSPIVNYPIPNNFLELKRMYYADTYETLDQIDVETLPHAKYVTSTISGDGRPTKFARNGDHWILNAPSVIGTRITFVYWANIPYLVEDTDTDDLLAQVDGAILYRTLAEAYRFLEDIEMSEYWMNKAILEMTIVQDNANTAEVTGSVIAQSNNPWF